MYSIMNLKSLYYSFIYPYMIYCNQVWGSVCKTNIEPLLILQKWSIRIILGVYPRYPSEPSFITLKFLNYENIFKYFVGRLMYRIYYGEVSVLHCLKNSDIHVHNTRQKCHYHMPLCRTWGNVVWVTLALLYGTAFLVIISIQTSASLFSLEVIKQQYVITYFNRSHVPHVFLTYNYW